MDAVTEIARGVELIKSYVLTDHAWCRMTARGIPALAVNSALEYGRPVHLRGALVYALGRNEVARAASQGVELRDWEGVQVVCAPDQPVVLTVYRNRDFRRSLRERSRSHSGKCLWQA